MTTFTGKLLEYSFVSIDRFNGENLNSKLYFLSHCHKDHIEGLLDEDFIKRLQQPSNNDMKLYTSETTKNLMRCDREMEDLVDYVVGIPIHQPTHIHVNHDNSEEENIIVTLISAGHCVGSVMILFEGKKGNVLYTGDFRLGHEEIKKISISLNNLKSMYVDTTFCCPGLKQFPTREKTKDCIIEIIRSWITKGPNYVVHLKCKGRYGYEYIMNEVAKYFGVRLHVNEWRLRMSARLPNMLKHFTTVSTDSQIHCCYFGKESFTTARELPCCLQYLDGKPVKVITIVPSSLYFMKKGVIPDSGKAWFPHQRLWRVFHSMHASQNEIREVISYFKPSNIYPCVPPVDCQDILVAYDRLQDLKSKSLDGAAGKRCGDSQESLNDNIKTETETLFANNPIWKDEMQKSNGIQDNFLSSPDKGPQSPPPKPMKRRRHLSNNKNKIIKEKSNNLTSERSFSSTPKKENESNLMSTQPNCSKEDHDGCTPSGIEFIEESTINNFKEERFNLDHISGVKRLAKCYQETKNAACSKINTVDYSKQTLEFCNQEKELFEDNKNSAGIRIVDTDEELNSHFNETDTKKMKLEYKLSHSMKYLEDNNEEVNKCKEIDGFKNTRQLMDGSGKEAKLDVDETLDDPAGMKRDCNKIIDGKEEEITDYSRETDEEENCFHVEEGKDLENCRRKEEFRLEAKYDIVANELVDDVEIKSKDHCEEHHGDEGKKIKVTKELEGVAEMKSKDRFKEHRRKKEDDINIICISSGDENCEDDSDSDLTLSFSQEQSSDSSQTF